MQRFELVIDRQLAAALQCAICFELLTAPINCVRGHSFCKDCISRSGSTSCPTCRGAIDPSTAAINFIAVNLINKLQCRCPNNVGNSLGSIGHNGSSSSNALEAAAVAVAAEDEQCAWVGELEALDAHIRVCRSVPRCCALRELGCGFSAVGTARMNAHMHACMAEHNKMLADAIGRVPTAESVVTLVALVQTLQTRLGESAGAMQTMQTRLDETFSVVETLQAKVGRMAGAIETVQTRLVEVDSGISSIHCHPSSLQIRWTILAASRSVGPYWGPW